MPRASSWATPPEFYIDEGLVGKTLRRFFEDLGYTVHTPAKVFGSRHRAQGTPDEVWMARCGENRWAALARDTKIMQRPAEIAAFKAAKIHIFYYPGNARRDELVRAAEATLVDVCTYALRAGGGAWRIHGGNRSRVEPLTVPELSRRRRRAGR
ncbi:hypothetical protein [Mycobacterium sp.]|uniref:PIN-like domain-containing protein n=1 Tax=Mycobacterium sp. TaxID=1785 RepID=UPI002D123483|nr:hypothetical protein [Mycobacterium sp.]HTY33149.1 hypothetical protein [Mycobacterium sp.]